MNCKDKRNDGNITILIKKHGDDAIDIVKIEKNKSIRKAYSSKNVRDFELEMLERFLMGKTR